MFNIKRFDPSQPTPSASSSASAAGLSDLAKKIEERRQKRKAGDAGLDAAAVSAPAPAAPAATAPTANVEAAHSQDGAGEWKPAPGESPADREKRIKREKRAQRLGVTFDLTPAGPSGSSYVAPPASYDLGNGQGPDDGAGAGGAAAIHPSRLAAPALAKEVERGEPKEKTPARKNYLKKKRERSKGKKAGEPSAKKVKREKKGGEEDGEKAQKEGQDEEESSADEDDKQAKLDAAAQKKLDILQKKEERKIKRDAKKAEQRQLKAAGQPIAPTLPRVIRTLPVPQPADVPLPEPAADAEPTAEQLELAALEASRLARKDAKRLKRASRRLSPPPPPPVALEVEPEAPDDASHLIPTAHVLPRSLSPSAVDPIEIDPISQADPVPKRPTTEEPAPLLRLPGATRPAPPSARTLGALNVHESVRNKRVVDPEVKVVFGEGVGESTLGVSERGRKRLKDMGVVEAFAVQTAVLPLLLDTGAPTFLYAPFAPPQDVCVSAPTGSGKTLSYVVPIIETLHGRVVTRLRALVLLPTRDLVAQVRETFEAFGKGTGLKVGTATGQHSFAHEQVSLVGDSGLVGHEGGTSQIDILIATPGRLMDHIRSTHGFSLQHLRYLVIDEADRLLNQSFHDWLPSILAALKPPTTLSGDTLAQPQTADALAPEWWDAKIGRVLSDVDERALPSCQKLLFSATLSRDPAKIDALHLHRPVYISVEDALDPNAEDQEIDDELKFTLPATLQEYMIVSPSTHKPLYLFHLLHTLALSSALCFTKSVDAATRLAKLVEFFEDARSAAEPDAKRVVVNTYSSELMPGERARILASFKKGEIQMLICSDLISRGIDLPHVSHVISYDIPTDMRKYVHRVGRTARAGKAGDAWSLVEDQEAAPFKAIMNAAQHLPKISRVRVKDNLVEPFVPHYQVALERLRLHFATGREKEQAV